MHKKTFSLVVEKNMTNLGMLILDPKYYVTIFELVQKI